MTDMKILQVITRVRPVPKPGTPHHCRLRVCIGTVQGPKEGTFQIIKRAKRLYITNGDYMVSLPS